MSTTSLDYCWLDEEKYPAALEKCDSAIAGFTAGNDTFGIVYTSTNRAKILAQLGRFGEARQLLEELFKKTADEGGYLQVLPELELVKAETGFQ